MTSAPKFMNCLKIMLHRSYPQNKKTLRQSPSLLHGGLVLVRSTFNTGNACSQSCDWGWIELVVTFRCALETFDTRGALPLLRIPISEELKGKDIQQALDRKHTLDRKNVVTFLPGPVSVFVMGGGVEGWGYQSDCSSSSKIKIHLYLWVCMWVSVCHAHASACGKESTGSPEIEVLGVCEVPHAGTGNRTESGTPGKASKRS